MRDDSAPRGWEISRFDSVAKVISGKNQKDVENSSGPYPIYGSGGVFGKSTAYLCEAGTTVVGRKGTINSPIFVNERFWNVDTAFGLSPIRSDSLLPLFLFYFCQGFNFTKLDKSTTIPSLAKRDIEAIEFPLPPLAEQKRIVAKIEKLFSELDAGEESLRVARRQLGVYRQSLLKQAFEGKLTVKWRERTRTPFEWRHESFGAFITRIDAGKSFRCEERRPKPNEIGVAKVSAVTWGKYDEAESKTCVDPAKVNPAYFIRAGDFLISRANTIELVGACVIVHRVTQQVMLSDKTLRLHIDDEQKHFFLHFLRSRQGRSEIEKRSTGNQESMRNIGQESIRSIVVPVCSLSEQHEIVRLLDEQFEVIERNEREIDAALRRSEALRQAILKKAFTGQLVPQDPADEPASALLERIRKERQLADHVPKRKTARKKAKAK